MAVQVRHIVLMGFMGSGKTTVGRIVAALMNFPFVDLDAVIVEEKGQSIADIFADEGETAFRKIESSALAKILGRSESHVISLGGGTPCFNDNMNLIKNCSITFYLRLGVARLASRLSLDGARPLIANKSQAELLRYISETLQGRRRYYEVADYTIRATGDPQTIAQRIVQRMQNEIQE